MFEIERPVMAVPTKSLGNPSLDWLAERGIKIPTDLPDFDRMCFVDLPDEDFDILRSRPKEVPERVFCGDSAIGISCTDGLVESERELTVVKELGFGACKMSLMVLQSSDIEDIAQLDGLKVATSYPVATKRFFDSADVELREIIVVGGAVEGMLRTRASRPDAIVDIVDKGTSQRANNLRVVAELGSQQAILIENPELASVYADVFQVLRENVGDN